MNEQNPPADTPNSSLFRKTQIMKRHLQPREIRSALLKVLSSTQVKRVTKLSIIPDDAFLEDLSNRVQQVLQTAKDEVDVGAILKKDEGGTMATLYNTDMVLLASAIRDVLLKHYRLGNEDIPIKLMHGILDIEERKPEKEKQTARLLIVDDNKQTCQMLCALVRKIGFEATAAHNWDELVKALAAAPHDLILLDYDLPEVRGDKALRRLKQSDSPYASIPVIMISAVHDVAVIKRCLQSGAKDYILKPFKSAVLLGKLKAAVAK